MAATPGLRSTSQSQLSMLAQPSQSIVPSPLCEHEQCVECRRWSGNSPLPEGCDTQGKMPHREIAGDAAAAGVESPGRFRWALRRFVSSLRRRSNSTGSRSQHKATLYRNTEHGSAPNLERLTWRFIHHDDESDDDDDDESNPDADDENEAFDGLALSDAVAAGFGPSFSWPLAPPSASTLAKRRRGFGRVQSTVI